MEDMSRRRQSDVVPQKKVNRIHWSYYSTDYLDPCLLGLFLKFLSLRRPAKTRRDIHYFAKCASCAWQVKTVFCSIIWSRDSDSAEIWHPGRLDKVFKESAKREEYLQCPKPNSRKAENCSCVPDSFRTISSNAFDHSSNIPVKCSLQRCRACTGGSEVHEVERTKMTDWKKEISWSGSTRLTQISITGIESQNNIYYSQRHVFQKALYKLNEPDKVKFVKSLYPWVSQPSNVALRNLNKYNSVKQSRPMLAKHLAWNELLLRIKKTKSNRSGTNSMIKSWEVARWICRLLESDRRTNEILSDYFLHW